VARKKHAPQSRSGGFVVGRITITRRGYGFVESPEGDLYVAARDTGGAMHRDIVAVKPDVKRGRQGRSGRVIRVVERAHETVVGRFERSGSIGTVVPADPRIRTDVLVPREGIGEARTGDIVVARITMYPSRNNAAQGFIEEVVGREDEPGIRIEMIIREHGLRTEFPEDVEAEASAIELAVAAEESAGREDIRGRFTFTIDPVDAKDFDDAITIEYVEGLVRLGVHIADVSHYVPWGTPIDEEARLRATSVYLVDRVLPMLPEELSNGICSLNPDVDRLSFTVDMVLTPDAQVQSYRLYPSIMRSDRRFNYDEVQSWLDGAEPFPDAQSEKALRDFARIAHAIAERRIGRGGLDFETVEAKVQLDETGKPVDVRIRERTDATNMIEESMILANETVASHMGRAKAPMVYRIHEDPDPDALAQVASVLKEFDYPVTDVHGASPATFQRIIRFAHTRPEKLLINSLLLRALERARYVDYLDSHFGLASEAYCHFTSPIRRYPDLLVHRLLKAQLTKTLTKDPAMVDMAEDLEWLAEHCSFMEREAEAAEDESVRFKLAELMSEHIGEVFEGAITGVQPFGLFVQLANTAEGLVHVESMKGDYWRLDAERFLLFGEETGATYRLGERVNVRILNVTLADSRIDLELA